MATFNAEEVAAEGLDIRGFHFKWKTAQVTVREAMTRHFEYEDGRHLLPYWEQVRLLFLELGGQYIGQRYGEVR